MSDINLHVFTGDKIKTYRGNFLINEETNGLHKTLSTTKQGEIHRIQYPMPTLASDYILPSLVTGISFNKDSEVTDVWVKVLLH